MSKHRGEIVEGAVRKSGFSIKKLAERLKISRNTIYNRFSEPTLDYEFILQISNVIHYDFSRDFPEIKHEIEKADEPPSQYVDRGAAELLALKDKYANLLERYNKLLVILARLAGSSDLKALRKEAVHFLDQDSGIP